MAHRKSQRWQNLKSIAIKSLAWQLEAFQVSNQKINIAMYDHVASLIIVYHMDL